MSPKIKRFVAEKIQLVVEFVCFPAGTQVALPHHRFKSIERIHAGDLVMSRDERTGRTSVQRVVQTFKKHTSALVRLRLSDGETLRATPEHPFSLANAYICFVGKLASHFCKPANAMSRFSLPRFLVLTILLCLCSSVAHAQNSSIVVTTQGHGPDVILIPGLASSGQVWNKTVDAFKDRYTFHVVQVKGFAGMPADASLKTDGKVSTDKKVLTPLVNDVHLYIQEHHLKKPAVIGHSMGGLAALLLAEDHPDDVGRLLIVDSLPFYGLTQGPTATVATLEPLAAQMRDKLIAGTADSFAATEKITMKRLVKSDGPDAQAAITAAANSDKDVVALAFYDDLTTDARPKLNQIAVPVTMLYPWDATTGAPQSLFDQLYQGAYAPLKGAQIKRIDGSYHFIMIDQPEAFEREVKTFLAP